MNHYKVQKTKHTTMNFAVNSVEYSVDPNEDVCATGKKD
jgi:hypothetical protein